jgi:hypothetical protein
MFENFVVLLVDTAEGTPPGPLLECIALPFLGFPIFELLTGVASIVFIAVILPPLPIEVGNYAEFSC